VIQRGANELADMLVGERVVDVLAVSAALHDALRVQDAELLRQGGELRLAGFGELGDAPLAAIELVQEAKPRQIASGSEQRGSPFEGRVADLDGLAPRGVGAARVGRLGGHTVFHFNDC